jgi:aldehyde:ferredoxin oxidoreductase
MPHGYNGKILRVDLSSGKIASEEYPDQFYRRYFGGEGFIGYFLLKEVPKGADPLGPENKLIFAAGPLFGEADSGGYWGAELKMAGFDAIIVEGRAQQPVYLSIRDGTAEIRDAGYLWGMKGLECQEAIRQELGDALVKVTYIGPAGENLVRYACVMNDLDAAAGRTGMGAVMGAKNLKAIACPVTNKGMHDFGTARMTSILDQVGGLPVRNFQLGSIEGADNISGQAMKDTILTRRRACFACPVQCKREVQVDQPYEVDPRYGGPEYETLAALGSDCGITDLPAVAKGNEMVNAYGLDSISCGATIAFAMECFENGLLSEKDTGGIDLRFGNESAMLQMIDQIALRQGIGDMLAEGVARAAQKIGPGAEEFAMHIKGQELPMHEPRLKQGLGVGYSISPTGADHCHNIHDTVYTDMTPMMAELGGVGILEPLPADDLSAAKMRLLKYYSEFMHLLNCAVCCYFVMSISLVGFDRLTQLTKAVTGWNTTFFEMLKVGERAANLARVFNLREGLTAADDTMPRRFFQPHPSGPLKAALDAKAFQEAKETYYGMMDWPGGVPTAAKLEELGIEWAVTQLPE